MRFCGEPQQECRVKNEECRNDGPGNVARPTAFSALGDRLSLTGDTMRSSRYVWPVLLWLTAGISLAQAPGEAESPASQPESRPPDRSAGYKLERGSCKVRTIRVATLHDEKRDEDLPILIRFPLSAAGDEQPTRPLIIFSHGAGGSSDAFVDLSAHWASYGYIVVHPTHADSIALRRRQGEDLSELRRNPKRLRTDVDIPGRVADVVLILDRIDEIERLMREHTRTGETPRVDRDRIGLAGHSAGAFTTQVVFGAAVRGARFLGKGTASLADDRIRAAILISGQGTTSPAFTEDSWKGIRKPMMVYAGSLDRSPISNETPESRRHPFEYAAPGDKYLVFIEGATHASYSGKVASALLRERPTTPIAVITDAVAAGTLAFWDAYLLHEERARSFLGSGEMERLTGGAAKLSRK